MSSSPQSPRTRKRKQPHDTAHASISTLPASRDHKRQRHQPSLPAKRLTLPSWRTEHTRTLTLLAFWITRGALPPAPPACRHAAFLDDRFTTAQLRAGFAHAYYLRRAAVEYNRRLRRQLEESSRFQVTSMRVRDRSETAGDEDEDEEIGIVEANEEQEQHNREGDEPAREVARAAVFQQTEVTPEKLDPAARPAVETLSLLPGGYYVESTESLPHTLPRTPIARHQAWQSLQKPAPGGHMSEGEEGALEGLGIETTAASASQVPTPPPLRWALPWRADQLAQEEDSLTSSCAKYAQPHYAAFQSGWSNGADAGFEEGHREGHENGYERGYGDGWTQGLSEGYDAGNLHGDGWEERAKCAGYDEHEELVAEELKRLWVREKAEMLSLLDGRSVDELKGMIIGACFERDGWMERNNELEWRVRIARERRSGRSLIVKFRIEGLGATGHESSTESCELGLE